MSRDGSTHVDWVGGGEGDKYTWVRNAGQDVCDELVGVAMGPMDEDDCIRYLAASCRSVPSLRLQKCRAAGLDSMVQSSETVDPSGAPINCWWSVTEGGTVGRIRTEIKKRKEINKFCIKMCAHTFSSCQSELFWVDTAVTLSETS